jgi:hypothetical protein
MAPPRRRRGKLLPGASASAASTLPLDHRLKAREPRRGDRHAGPFLSAFQACTSFLERSRGYALRARPWLPSAAPAALSRPSAAPAALSRPSAAPAAHSHDHLPLLRRALTTICRACGALSRPSAAPAARSHDHLPRLRRSHDHLPRPAARSHDHLPRPAALSRPSAARLRRSHDR